MDKKANSGNDFNLTLGTHTPDLFVGQGDQDTTYPLLNKVYTLGYTLFRSGYDPNNHT